LRRTLLLFTLGAAILLPFDSTLTVTSGVVLLLASIVSGVFAVADPVRLAQDDD